MVRRRKTKETSLEKDSFSKKVLKEELKGRKEDTYFFPDERVTIKASSLKDALKKVKERK